MIYKYLTKKEGGSLVGVYLSEPSYNENLYLLGECTESEGAALFGESFTEYVPKIEDEEI